MPPGEKVSVAHLLGELGRLDCEIHELAEIFTAFAEYFPVPMWVFDQTGIIVYNNLASCRFGTGQNTIGETPDSFSPDIQAMLKEGLALVQAKSQAATLEGWISSPVIGIRYLKVDFLPLPKGLVACLAYDLTENKHIEEALHASEGRSSFFADILDRALVPFGAVYPAGQLMTVNHAFCQLTGYSEDELLHLSLFEELTAGASWDLEQVALQALKRSGSPQRYEKEIPHKDGSLVPVEIFIQQVSDDDGLIQYLFFFATDITDSRRARELLRDSEQRLALALEGAADGIWDYDPLTGVIYRSPQMGQHLGYGPEGLAPTLEAWQEIVHPEDQARVWREWQAHLDGLTEHYSSEHRLRAANGEYVWILDTGKVVQRDAADRPLRIAGTYKNITERKLADQERQILAEQLRQSQKIEALGTLAGGIAHDFNNLLFAIIGYAELVRDELSPGTIAYENIQGLVNAGQRAKGLVQQILTFSRKTNVEPVPLDINVVVREVHELLLATLPSTLEIDLQLEPQTGVVLADPTEIQQVLLNLCTNAAQAIGASYGTLKISTSQVEISAKPDFSAQRMPPGPYIRLEVKDSGPGMPPEILERIFEPFFTTKEQGKGTGLGLAIVHGIVGKLGGEVYVESEVGRGTTFCIYLPALPKMDLADGTEHQPMPRGDARILIVDDEPDVITVLRQILESLGYAVTSCETGLEALELLKLHPAQFDLVITDQTMPKLTGVQLATALLALRPDLPVILITGYSEVVDPAVLAAARIAKCLLKPIQKHELATCVHSTLSSPQSAGDQG